MSDEAIALQTPGRETGWIVTFAGTGINLALGVLYTWSVIAEGVPRQWNWSQSDKSWPYAVACLVFSLVMVPAGRLQDRFGPRLVAAIGGILVGGGMVLASFTTTPMGYAVGFGLLAGTGIAFGYASATPPAVKWFPAARTGLIAGIVVSGFGLASAYMAFLARWVTAAFSVSTMMLSFGIAFLVVVVALAQLLRTPPEGYVPAGGPSAGGAARAGRKEDCRPGQMLRTWQFWVLWFMYACGAGAGLMIISVARKLGGDKTIGTLEAGTIMVVTLGIGNGAGRILAGMISDRLGRRATMAAFFLLQAVLIVLLALSGTIAALGTGGSLAVLAALVGANYGANLTLFPSATKDYYGLKHFGTNYGLVFTAWGVGGFTLSKLAGWVYDGKIVAAWKGDFSFAYYASAVLLILAAVLSAVLKAPHHAEVRAGH